MSKKELFTDRRWTDIPKARIVGYREITEEEKEMVRKYKEEIQKAREKD